MRARLSYIVVVLTCALLACATLPGDLALVGATVYLDPETPALHDAVVLVEGGRITAVGSRADVAIPPGIEQIDCRGLTVAAGFWNSHVHLTPNRVVLAGFLPGFLIEEPLRDLFTSRGFAHVVDTGSLLASTTRLRDRIARSTVAGPGIRTAGGGFVPEDGSPFYLAPFELPELLTAAHARKAVSSQLDGGADGIKLFTGSLAAPGDVIVMPADVIRAAVQTAHERGAFVIAHPSSSAGARAAIEGGVDILAHTFPDENEGPWDRSLIPLMVKSGVALVPTLKLWDYEFGGAQTALRPAQEQVRAFAAQGGEILFGTDVGYMTDYDPTDEYVYLQEAGLSFRQTLTALTTAPAARFGAAGHLGRIATGFAADLVVLDGDPASDPRAFGRVRYLIRRGTVLFANDRDAESAAQ